MIIAPLVTGEWTNLATQALTFDAELRASPTQVMVVDAVTGKPAWPFAADGTPLTAGAKVGALS